MQRSAAPRFDVVLMDLHMPVLDGFARHARDPRAARPPRRRRCPIVALTADAFAETRDRCLVAGMNDFLTKPVQPAEAGARRCGALFGAGGAARAPADAAPPSRRRTARRSRRWSTTAAIAMCAAGDAARAAGRDDRTSFLDQGPQTVRAAARRGARRPAARAARQRARGARARR